MNVTQITSARFHHFHLARQMERLGILDKIWSGYPRFKLTDEQGIPPNKLNTYPWICTPYMMRGKLGLGKYNWLNKEWAYLVAETLDRHVSKHINHPTILIGLSGCGLISGKRAKDNGGYYICDRGSTHIRFQDEILHEEYKRWGLKFIGVDPRVINKEEAEYFLADKITVPSEFVKKSFIQMGVPVNKIEKVNYGARIDRFKKVADPPDDVFRVLWVGGVTIRKGFFDLLEAFKLFKHPKKELVVVGSVAQEIKNLLIYHSIEGVIFKGIVPNKDLGYLYSTSHVFVLPSIEEGLALVQGEALACGCPIIATYNSGSEDLFDNGVEGFIIPIRSPMIIAEKLQELADDEYLRVKMSIAGQEKVKKINGWDNYGNNFKKIIDSLSI